MRVRKGDTVQVLSGNDKGKTGEVLEVIPKADKIIVKGVNIRYASDTAWGERVFATMESLYGRLK